METQPIALPRCSKPDHQFFDQDSVIYQNASKGIRATIGVRERPISSLADLAELKRDLYLIIEVPLTLPERELIPELKGIYREARKEKLYPESAAPAIAEMHSAANSGDFNRLKVAVTKVEEIYSTSAEVIHKRGWQKRGPKPNARIAARNEWIVSKARSYLKSRHISPLAACELVRNDLKVGYRGKKYSLSIKSIGRIAKLSI